jgi:hypothetical protein
MITSRPCGGIEGLGAVYTTETESVAEPPPWKVHEATVVNGAGVVVSGVASGPATAVPPGADGEVNRPASILR